MKQFIGRSKEMDRKVHAPFTLPQCWHPAWLWEVPSTELVQTPSLIHALVTCVCVCVCVVQCSFLTCSFCVATTTIKIQNCSITTWAITLSPTYHLSRFQPLTCSFVIWGGSYKWNHIVSNIWGPAFLFCIIHFQPIQVVHVTVVHPFWLLSGIA